MKLRFAAYKPLGMAAAPPPPSLVRHFQFASTQPLPPKPPAKAAAARTRIQVREQVSDRASLLGAIQAGKALKKVEMKEVNLGYVW